MLVKRLGGGGGGAEDYTAGSMSMDPLMHFAPGQFFMSPGLWIGLAIAAAFIMAAIRLRRSQGPI
jgi:hypothetical protein